MTLLGGEARPIPAYNSLGMLPPGEAADEAGKTVAAGFRAIKIKVGWPSLDQDLGGGARRAPGLPDDVAFMVDFNQSLSVAEAIRRGRALDGEGVAWIEEPVRGDDFRGAAEVAAALRRPIQIGENSRGLSRWRRRSGSKASDLVMPDVQQMGGVTGWLRAAALAHAAGVPCSSHLFIEASAHLLAVTPDLPLDRVSRHGGAGHGRAPPAGRRHAARAVPAGARDRVGRGRRAALPRVLTPDRGRGQRSPFVASTTRLLARARPAGVPASARSRARSPR